MPVSNGFISGITTEFGVQRV